MIAPSMESDLYSLRLECAMLQKQVRELRKDAERYRWLAGDSDGNSQDDFIQWIAGNVATRAEVDAAIDAAMLRRALVLPNALLNGCRRQSV